MGIFYYSLVCIGAVGSDARDATCDSPLTLSARKQGAMETTAHRKSRRKVEKRKHNPDRLPQERSERNYMDFIRQRNLSKDQPKKFHSKRNKTFGARSGARGGRRRGKEIQRFKRARKRSTAFNRNIKIHNAALQKRAARILLDQMEKKIAL